MSVELRGSLAGEGLRIGIVVARFNEFVTCKLLEGAQTALARHGVSDDRVTVAWVPGSFELPVVARRMASLSRYDAVICLGAVIRGETDHYEHIARAASDGIAKAGLECGIPVIFGVLTTDTVEQALARSGGEHAEHADVPRIASKVSPAGAASGTNGNAGFSAGLAAIEMANLLRELD